MASPFRFFWKYQRPMMVVVTGIAIICFTLDDSLRMSNDSQATSRYFLPFLLGLIAACIAWVAGMRAGAEGKNYWWQGAIIGAALGVVFQVSTQKPEEGIATTLGNLNPKKIRNIPPLQMPKFSLSEADATALVDYFAAVSKRPG